MKIINVVGARPQFIKYSPLSKELRKNHQDVLIHTGQHYDYNMDKVFFNELNIPEPDYNLGIGSGTPAYQTGSMMKGLEEIFVKENPDLVMVYGDTNSTIAGALAAIKLNIKVAHVEAGERSFDKTMPEEVNRVITDHCSGFLFCSTPTAVDNLHQENINRGVYLTGDVMVDALIEFQDNAEQSKILSELQLEKKQYILVTLHRAGNTDVINNLKNIVSALVQLSNLGEKIIFPLHPRTRKFLTTYGIYQELSNKVKLVEPLGYYDFLKLLNNSKKILTDSGGVQKEAYILKVPCITLRENTEWVETVNDGWNVLAGSDERKIVAMANGFTPTHKPKNVFGSQACKKIAEILGKTGIKGLG